MGVTKKQVFQPFLELYFNPCTNREEHNVGIYMILTPYSDISIHTPPHMMQLLILVANSSKHFAIWCFHGFCATPLRQLAIQACVVWSYHLILTDRIGSPPGTHRTISCISRHSRDHFSYFGRHGRRFFRQEQYEKYASHQFSKPYLQPQHRS